jgi:MaoC like domain
MAGDLYLEDLHVGQRFAAGPVAVSADEIKSFAAEFDPQPFHLDEVAAKTTLFKGLAASGWHTAVLTMRMLTDGGLPIATGVIGLAVLVGGRAAHLWLGFERDGVISSTSLSTRSSSPGRTGRGQAISPPTTSRRKGWRASLAAPRRRPRGVSRCAPGRAPCRIEADARSGEVMAGLRAGLSRTGRAAGRAGEGDPRRWGSRERSGPARAKAGRYPDQERRGAQALCRRGGSALPKPRRRPEAAFCGAVAGRKARFPPLRLLARGRPRRVPRTAG